MCNLNILINLTNQPLKTYAFLTGASNLSYKDNSDGDGIYFDNDVLVKSKDKIDLFNFIDIFKKSKLFLSHQRLKTSGESEIYTQPFENPDFVMAHNGVLHQYVKDEKSDTFVVFNEFINLFEKLNGSREERIIKVAETLFKDEYGSWSISLFDKKTKILYYFKDCTTKINCFINKNKTILYLYTNPDNEIFLNIYNNEFEETDIDSYVMYKITYNNIIEVNKIKELNQRFSSYVKKDNNITYGKNWKINKINKKNKIRSTKMDKKFDHHMLNQKVLAPCDWCSNQTNYALRYSAYRICRNCFFENYIDVIQEERFNRDIIKGHIKPTAEEINKRFK